MAATYCRRGAKFWMDEPGNDDNALMGLAREAVDVALAGDIKRGLSMALDARHRARSAGDSHAELAALNATARCHSLRNDSIASLSVGIDAATLAQKLGDRLALAHALCAIANTAFTLQLLEESIDISARAVEDSMLLRDNDLECRARQVYGVILGDLKRFGEAREQLHLALAAAERDGRLSLQYRVQGNLASLSRKEARFHAASGDELRMQAACSAALAAASSLVERAKPQKLYSLEMNMTSLAGEIHGLQGDIDSAVNETRLAIELAARARQPSNIPPAALRLAKLLQSRGELTDALAVLKGGLAAAETLRPTFRIAELCEMIGSIEEQRGDAATASSWQQRAAVERQSFAAERQIAAGYMRKLNAEIAAATGGV